MKLAILGTGSTLRHAPLGDPAWTFWAMADLWGQVLHLDVVVEIHDKAELHALGLWSALKTVTCPLYMQRADDELPAAVAYPLDAVRARFTPAGRAKPPLGSSIDYLLALALLQRELPDTIALFGGDMHQDTEFTEQRHTAAFWIGLATGMGIRVELPAGSELLSVPFLYGFEAAARRAAEGFGQERVVSHQATHDQKLRAACRLLDGFPLLEPARAARALLNARDLLSQCFYFSGAADEAAARVKRVSP